MEFTEKEKKCYIDLIKEPISFWVLVVCFLACSVTYSALKNYAGWTWLGDLSIELPLLVLLILVFNRNRITPKEREVLRKLATEHPYLIKETDDHVQRNLPE